MKRLLENHFTLYDDERVVDFDLGKSQNMESRGEKEAYILLYRQQTTPTGSPERDEADVWSVKSTESSNADPNPQIDLEMDMGRVLTENEPVSLVELANKLPSEEPVKKQIVCDQIGTGTPLSESELVPNSELSVSVKLSEIAKLQEVMMCRMAEMEREQKRAAECIKELGSTVQTLLCENKELRSEMAGLKYMLNCQRQSTSTEVPDSQAKGEGEHVESYVDFERRVTGKPSI
jgi:hypothetical protein